ncbi:hypothetical protein [Acrocarpospora sp. B8E8]|uniref:hypothetical protein n=1 Tax=Acrocarpospora sp. B8E8 TaxID=3153572 RepID=UPI00325CA78B
MDPVREYVDAVANDDVRDTLRWLDEAGYRVTSSQGGPTESFGDAHLVFTGRREVEITRDRGQWMISISLAPGGERLWLDVLMAARRGAAWAPSPHGQPLSSPLPDQLPADVSWSASLPDVLGWLDEPGAAEEAEAATMKARDLMWQWLRDGE